MHPHLEITSDVPLEDAEVWATSSRHIGMRGTFTANGVPHQARLDLHLRDGFWQMGDTDDWQSVYHALMLHRTDDFKPPNYKKKEPSASARAKALQVLPAWLSEFAQSHDGLDLLHRADVEHVKHERKKIGDQLDELHAKEEELKMRLRDLEVAA